MSSMSSIRCVVAAPFLVALFSAACSPRISETDLAKRAEEADVRWNNYQEDIKAQLGATPVAEWTGAPESAARDGAALRIAFAIQGPWKSRGVAMPILIRDPLGNIVRESGATPTATGADYRFDIDPSWASSPVPWVELQFPGNETRIVFRQDGTWRSHR